MANQYLQTLSNVQYQNFAMNNVNFNTSQNMKRNPTAKQGNHRKQTFDSHENKTIIYVQNLIKFHHFPNQSINQWRQSIEEHNEICKGESFLIWYLADNEGRSEFSARNCRRRPR